MSRKFVPSFMKKQEQEQEQEQRQGSVPSVELTQTRAFINTNKFAPLSDDKHINTSRPAKEAPKLAPATLASITTNGQGGGKGTYASKMAERARMASNPNYVPPPKPLDVTSENEFPSLGGSKKIDSSKVDSNIKKSGSFASMARDWAKQKEEEEEAERMMRIRLEEEERELRLLKSMVAIGRRKNNTTDHRLEGEEEDYDESSLGGDSDNDEMPEDSEPSEDDNDDDEYNQNVGWDGRRRDDLY